MTVPSAANPGLVHVKSATKAMTMQVEPQSQLSSDTQHSFWLLPAEPLKGQLRSIVQDLAKEYDGIDFEPHVTIYCGPSDDDRTRIMAHEVRVHKNSLHTISGIRSGL